MSKLEFADEQLLKGLQTEFPVWILGAVAYLKRQGLPIEDWGKFMGDVFAPSWNEMKGKGANEIAHVTAFNFMKMGATIVSLDGDEKRATAVFDYPLWQKAAANLDVPLEEWDVVVNCVHEPIGACLGMKFAIQRNGARWTFEFSY